MVETWVEDVEDLFPGALVVANLLRTVGWVVVGGAVVVGIISGAAVGARWNGAEAVVGGVIGGLVGGLVGVLIASTTFAIAYALLLLNEIESNTRVIAGGNKLTDEG